MGRYFNRCLDGDLLSINRILIKLIDINVKDLLKEFLDYRDKVIYFHSDKDRILYYNLKVNKYDYYCDKGNATYVINKGYEDNYKAFKAFDKILGVSNEYFYESDIEIKDYDYVYVYDDMPKYSSRSNNIFDIIFPYIRKNNNVVVYTSYNKISNFSSGRLIAKYIKNIILDDNSACLLFNKDNINREISIINYEKIGNVDKLYSVICNNRKQKDVLVKICYNDLVENNMRIGFKLYQIDKDSVKDINKIVDENTNYLNRLNTLNMRVEQEINILLNK